MKKLSSVIALLSVLLLSGCSRNSAAGSRVAKDIDCAIDIQVAVLSGYKPGMQMTDGDWHVATSCVLPVHSTGGPGLVVCNTDGTIIELQWSGVSVIENGTVIAFSGCKWGIKNRIDRRDGVKMSLTNSQTLNQTTNFGTDFTWLASCQLDTTQKQQSDHRLVIRGRLLPTAPPAQPLNLEKMAGLTH